MKLKSSHIKTPSARRGVGYFDGHSLRRCSRFERFGRRLHLLIAVDVPPFLFAIPDVQCYLNSSIGFRCPSDNCALEAPIWSSFSGPVSRSVSGSVSRSMSSKVNRSMSSKVNHQTNR